MRVTLRAEGDPPDALQGDSSSGDTKDDEASDGGCAGASSVESVNVVGEEATAAVRSDASTPSAGGGASESVGA